MLNAKSSNGNTNIQTASNKHIVRHVLIAAEQIYITSYNCNTNNQRFNQLLKYRHNIIIHSNWQIDPDW